MYPLSKGVLLYDEVLLYTGGLGLLYMLLPGTCNKGRIKCISSSSADINPVNYSAKWINERGCALFGCSFGIIGSFFDSLTGYDSFDESDDDYDVPGSSGSDGGGGDGYNSSENSISILNIYPQDFHSDWGTLTVTYKITINNIGDVVFRIVQDGEIIYEREELIGAAAGEYTLFWNGENNNGEKVATGIYKIIINVYSIEGENKGSAEDVISVVNSGNSDDMLNISISKQDIFVGESITVTANGSEGGGYKWFCIPDKAGYFNPVEGEISTFTLTNTESSSVMICVEDEDKNKGTEVIKAHKIPDWGITVNYKIGSFEKEFTINYSTTPYSINVLAGFRIKIDCGYATSYNWTKTAGDFYNSYYEDAILVSNPNTQVVYYQLPIPNSSVGSSIISVEKIYGTIVKKIQLKINYRKLKAGVKGDDIKMLQEILNYLGWQYKSGGSWHQLSVDGIWGNNTGYVVKRFKMANRGTWTSQGVELDLKAVKNLKIHYDNYCKAKNGFLWRNGINSEIANRTINNHNNDYIKDNFSDTKGWVDYASELLINLPSLIITPNPNWSTDKRRLLMGLISQESIGTHWENWNITFSRDNNNAIGALGFIQMMPFNIKTYNQNGLIPEIYNIYKPDDNLKIGASYLNKPCLYKGFVTGEYRVGGDDNQDVLCKCLAAYNGGNPDKDLSNLSWQYIVENFNNNEEYNVRVTHQSIHYALQIKQNIGLSLKPFEEEWLNNN